MDTEPTLKIIDGDPDRPLLVSVDRWPCLVCNTMVRLDRMRRTEVSRRNLDTATSTDQQGLVCLLCLRAHGHTPDPAAPTRRTAPPHRAATTDG